MSSIANKEWIRLGDFDQPPGARIVVAVDYGTTYTGLAWMQVDGLRKPVRNDLKVFTNWPSQNQEKVPSRLSYSKAQGAKQWGYDIDEESLILQWTKLELETRSTLDELETLRALLEGNKRIDDYIRKWHRKKQSPEELCKNSEDIIRDYLRKVIRHWREKMPSQAALDRVPIDVVVTHPVDWAYESMNATIRAVKSAFKSHEFADMFPTFGNIYITTEPEAAATAIMQDLVTRDANRIFAGQCFVVADAGGGTVDLASFRVESRNPNWRITPVGNVSGGPFGASYIDQEFLEWLSGKIEGLDAAAVGGHFVADKTKRVMLRAFENQKHSFTGEEGTDFFDIPIPSDTKFIEANEEAAESGMLAITRDDMMDFFEYSVAGTVNLINGQCQQLQNGHQGYEVSHIFLCGGFSSSKYLVSEVKAWANDRPHDTRVEQAEHHWSEVVRGAVLQGLGFGLTPVKPIRLIPRHFGICLSQRHDYRTVGATVTRNQLSGQALVRDQAVWLARQDDIIPPDKPVTSSYSVYFKLSKKDKAELEFVKVKIVATDVANPPNNIKDLLTSQRTIKEVRCPLREIPAEAWNRARRADDRLFDKFFWWIELKVQLSIDADVKITVMCGTAKVATDSLPLL